MKEIRLGYVATVVDDADYDLVKHIHWRETRSKYTSYARGWNPETKRDVLLHRYLLRPPEHLHVDHIDGNGLNNLRRNIRVVTLAQNRSRCRVTSQTGYKGVTKNRGRFLAQITIKGRVYNLGRYDDPIEAAIAYDVAAAQAFGEFAKGNFS